MSSRKPGKARYLPGSTLVPLGGSSKGTDSSGGGIDPSGIRRGVTGSGASTMKSSIQSSSSSLSLNKSMTTGSGSSLKPGSGDKKRDTIGTISPSSQTLQPPSKKIRTAPGTGSSPFGSSGNTSSMGFKEKSTATSTVTSVILSTGTPSGGTTSSSSSSSSTSKSGSKTTKRNLEELISIDSVELTGDRFLLAFEKAEKACDAEIIQALIQGALKKIKTTGKDKLDLKLCLDLLLAAKEHGKYYRTDGVLDGIFSLLRRPSSEIKSKYMHTNSGCTQWASLAINILTAAFTGVRDWPTSFVELWLEDICGERHWVDRSDCKIFVDNLLVSFGTEVPPPNVIPSSDAPGTSHSGSGGSSPSLSKGGDTERTAVILEDLSRMMIEESESFSTVTVRYANMEDVLDSMITHYIKEILQKRAPEVPKNVVKALALASGYHGVRTFVISKLEKWLHSPKNSRAAQELILYIAMNLNCPRDDSDILALCKLRIKTKPLIQFYALALKEMVRNNESTLPYVLHHKVFDELTSSKDPNNLAVLGSIMVSSPEASSELADIYMELLQHHDDHYQALRLLLREIVRAARFECDLITFVKGLLKKRELLFKEGDLRERSFKVIVELVMFSLFLTLSPNVKEASTMLKNNPNGPETWDMAVVQSFHRTLGKIQEEAVTWLLSTAVEMFRPSKKEYVIAVHKFILRDPIKDLQSRDNWPTDAEKAIFSRLCQEAPISENTLLYLLLLGLSKDNYLPWPEVIDLAEGMILKCASHTGQLNLSNPYIVECLFRLTAYKHPDKISLPAGYEPPILAISILYWKVWKIFAILAAFNPNSFGRIGWTAYPTLRVLMEMCMTNQFSYPTPASTESHDEVTSRELQTMALEKEAILEFETHLAAASTNIGTITEKTSHLLTQLMKMDPPGKSRCPPPPFIKTMVALNESLSLGRRLCRSRSPDFLVDLIQLNSGPIPWLSELVYEGSFEILPIQCLCEFMLGQTESIRKSYALEASGQGTTSSNPVVLVSEKHGKKGMKYPVVELHSHKDEKDMKLLSYLQDIVQGTNQDSVREVLEYFFRRLSSQKTQSRVQALQGLQLILSTKNKPLDENWFLDSIPNLPFFSDLQGMLMNFLRQAIQVENDPEWIAKYLDFLSTWELLESDEDKDGLALDVAQLVVERNMVLLAMLRVEPKVIETLFDIFLNYITKIREPHKSEYRWAGDQDIVLVQWPKERLEASMNILIVHATVISVSHYASTSAGSSNSKDSKKHGTGRRNNTEFKYNELLDIWFPLAKENSPRGYLLNTTEEAVLFPDWLRLKMIKTNNDRLCTVALDDLDIETLMVFVNSFGIPIRPLTAILYSLDKVVDTNRERLIAAIGDAARIKILVELHIKRGASGGKKLLELISSLIEPGEEDISIYDSQVKHRPILKIEDLNNEKGKGKGNDNDYSSKALVSAKNPFPSFSSSKGKEVQTLTLTPKGPTIQANVRDLCKQLINISFSSSSRRRSSVPVPMIVDESESPFPRRHSVTGQQVGEPSPSTSQFKRYNKGQDNIGHLVDMYLNAEPRIIGSAMDLQIPLLFGRCDSPPLCRSLLLTVLTHEAGWDTIGKCFDLLLKDFNPSYDSSAILDLISSTIANPKLWQGVDKYVPKHQQETSVFTLKSSQLLVMAEYIVEEVSQLEVKNTKFSISNLLGPTQAPGSHIGKKTKHFLEERVHLWLKCCKFQMETVDTIVNSLLGERARNPCTKRFVAQVYLEYPQIILSNGWQEKFDELSGAVGEDSMCSFLDTVTHTLIGAVADIKPGKEWTSKVTHEYELSLRKIASIHPKLLLRQLPLMNALLEGRVHLEFQVFHNQNHHVPFCVYLGLLDIMRPDVLKHMSALKSILALYIQLFTSYGHLRDYSMSVSRFAVLIHNLISTNYGEMKEFLTAHYNALRDLAAVTYYLDLGPLQNLMTSLVPPSASSELSVLTANSNEMDPFNMNATQSVAILERMQNANNDNELIPLLQELDSLSTRNPAVLAQFSEQLRTQLLSENDVCRHYAATLALKHMSNMPSSSKVYMETILQVLDPKNSHMIDGILERIHEFVVLSQENADVILNRLFELGVHSNTNVLPAITKTVALLRNQSNTVMS